MHVVKGGARLLLATTSFALATATEASERTRYGYDALGRLIVVGRSGTAAGSVVSNYRYDVADNRSNVTVAIGGLAPTPTPIPTPTPVPPPGSNNPPVAERDTYRTYQCNAVFNVLENDHDPDGDLLTITSISGSAVQAGYLSIQNNQFFWTDPGTAPGSLWGTYTISDGHGGTATGDYTIQALAGSC